MPRHGVEVREADINYSGWDNTLEPMHGRYFALRLGLRQIKGMKQEDADYLVAHRGEGYANVNALRDAGIPDAVLERLADADAFRSIGHDRRQALWEVSVREGRPNGMFTGQQQVEQQISLPAMRLSEHVVQDYATASLSLKAHPVSFVREKLAQLHITPARDLALKKDGIPIKVAGLILVRQRPGTASGICFITLEDETGTANLVVFENLFAKYRKEIIQSKLLMVEGKLQREGEVIHVVVQRCYNISRLLKQLTDTPVDEPPLLTLSRADEKDGPDIVLPQARNFR
ncbi:OB-fold nucleic acid binding domain-containing protein [Chitinophaga sedimenti]|uniref:helix-hairpin-helix domain-containing protein n=1 Tax=Chitinophaga sedimenti TaxID=2033606 RepID=UPI002004616F|nr:OB-fold nucleic acid binding domain-containing protein [Chitinophaga sedimenti]MCK7556331.1 OB-fold nucleic acid binding domain-containing protein [Chitinophaga sedimenti]